MGAGREGPPGPEVGEGQPPKKLANVEEVVTQPPITNTPSIAQPRHGDGLAALHRRRRASLRSVPLACGCRDPWPCRCSRPPLSQKMIDAGRDAARHLLEAGQVPLLELEVLRALYRRGGNDRVLAAELYELVGGSA